VASKTATKRVRKRRGRVGILTNMLLDWETREPRFGGGENYSVHLGRLLYRLGFDVTFFQAAPVPFEGNYYGFRVIALPFGETVSEFHTGVCNQFYYQTQDYDHVIHNLLTYSSGRVREDAIAISHGVWFDYETPVEGVRSPAWFEQLHRALTAPQRIVSVDTNTINVARALWPETARRMTYIPNFVDTDRFTPPPKRINQQPSILIPRRSEYARGSRLLEPILELLPADCRVRWVGYGEREEADRIKALAERDTRLEFHVATYEDMPRLYQRADICVIPTVACEGTSLACLEGLASGCAVVSTHVGGLANLIQPDYNGYLVDPRPESLAAAINRLIAEPEARSRLQSAGRQTSLQFTLAVWQNRWAHLLKRLGWIEDVDLRVLEEVTPLLTPSAGNTAISFPEELISSRVVIARLIGELTSLEHDVSGVWAETGEPAHERPTTPAIEELRASVRNLRHRLEFQIAEVAAREEIIASRDDGIAWLRQEVAGSMDAMEKAAARLLQAREEARHSQEEVVRTELQLAEVTALGETLKNRLADQTRIIEGLESRLAETTALSESLKDRLADQTQLVKTLDSSLAATTALSDSLRDRLAEQTRVVKALESRLGELKLLPHLLAAQRRAEDLEEVIAARDEGIAWLREELRLMQEKARQLASINELLGEDLSAEEESRQSLIDQVRDSQSALERITASRSWRVLSKYRRLKRRILRHSLEEDQSAREVPESTHPVDFEVLRSCLDLLLKKTRELVADSDTSRSAKSTETDS
jgi:glycosyltransferase involved in cell wall biosynthesis